MADDVTLAMQYLQDNKPRAAVKVLRGVLARQPNNLNAMHALGITHLRTGKLLQAERLIGKAVRAHPKLAFGHNNLGEVYRAQGKLEMAAACYRKALAIDPGQREAHYNLGIVQEELGQLEDAVACYRNALSNTPSDAETHQNIANALHKLGRLEEAVASLRSALACNPQIASIHNNLGLVLMGLGRLDEAIDSFQEAIKLSPALSGAHSNLGNVLYALERYEEAIDSCRRAIEIRPDHADAHSNLGIVLNALDRHEEAIECYQRAIQIDPLFPNALSFAATLLRKICDWSSLTETSSELNKFVRQSLCVVEPFVFLFFSDNPEDQHRCAKFYVQNHLRSHAGSVTQKASSSDERIRIAYVSADFRQHPVATLMAELFELHDRDRFEIIGISLGKDDQSAMRGRLRQAFDHFIDARQVNDHAVAEMIADRKIHIAIDLMGYTADSRPGVLACRPAPIQVNYLGIPATMGADFIDYILVDHFVVPACQQPHFSERLVHLPECYMVNDRKRVISDDTLSRAEAGLPEKGFVFCCFNNSYKFTPEIFDLWMRLLKSVPGSVLWLLSDNQVSVANLRREAKSREVDPDRVIFAPRVKLEDHMARHRLAGLFLDTLPYNAHTTASDALWMGLPVLTCPGHGFASRVAGSLLHAIGMPELVTGSLEAYETLALKLAREPELLAKVRDKLARNRTTTALFDSERFCRNLEVAYDKMFETWRKGEAPKPFAVEVTASESQPTPRGSPRT